MNITFRTLVASWIVTTFCCAADSNAAYETDTLQELQYRAWRYFEETTTSNGFVRDHLSDPALTSAGAAGFYLTALCVAEKNQWLTREAAASRALACLQAYSRLPRFHGFFGHYYDIGRLCVVPIVHEKDDGADVLQTALFLAGALTARVYFDQDNQVEAGIRELATRLYNDVEWEFLLVSPGSETPKGLLARYWSPTYGFEAGRPLTSHDHLESLLAYLLAIGSPTHPIPAEYWNFGWATTYLWLQYDSTDFIACAPLRSHILPHIWLDLRHMRDRFTDYYQNAQTAARANRAYCLTRLYPQKNIWGLSCCHGPSGLYCYGYPPETPRNQEDGVLCPAAGISSGLVLPYDMSRLLYLWIEETPRAFYGPYGFFDGISPKLKWQSSEYFAENLGMLLAAIENVQSGTIPQAFMRNQCVRSALEQVGFVGVLADFEPGPRSACATFRPRGAMIGFAPASQPVEGKQCLQIKATTPGTGEKYGVEVFPPIYRFAPFDYISLLAHPNTVPQLIVHDTKGNDQPLEVVASVPCPRPRWNRVYYDLGRTSNVDLSAVHKIVVMCAPTNERVSDFAIDELLLVTKLDTEPPSPVALASATPTRMAGEVALTWGPSGDDGEMGTCFRYLVRYSQRPIRDMRSFLSAQDGGPRGMHDFISGTVTNWHVVGLQPGETYYFAVCAEDLAGNLSTVVPDLSVTLPTQRFPDTFLLDDFEWEGPRADRPRWSAVSKGVTVETTASDSIKGRRCLKIALATTSAAAEVVAHLDVNDFSRFCWLSCWARGRATLHVELVDFRGTLLDCGRQQVLRQDGWSPVFFSIPAAHDFAQERVHSLIIRITPEDGETAEVLLDELSLSREKSP